MIDILKNRCMPREEAVVRYHEALSLMVDRPFEEQMAYCRLVAGPLFAETGWPLSEVQEEVISLHFRLNPQTLN